VIRIENKVINLIGCEKKISIDEMAEFEGKFKSRLPKEFKERYLKNNGGFLSEEDAENEVWSLPLGGFNPIKYGHLTIEGLMNDIDSINIEDGLIWNYGEMVPFAYDNGGNTVFLSLKNPTEGCVFVHVMDGNNLYKISETFSEFLEKLYSQ
jgi:hypothetical protein